MSQLFLFHLFCPPLFKSIGAIPAATATTKSAGYEIEFSKYPVVFFLIIMNAFHQITSPARERILFFPGYQFIQFQQAVITHAVIKSIRQERFHFIA
jgi:hypothetical protein